MKELAVTLFIATKLEECQGNSKYVDFEEDIHLVIYNERNKLPAESRVLYSLDPYGIEILSIEKVHQIKDMLHELLKYFEDNEEVLNFLSDLKILCNCAIQENKTIISVGD